MWVAVRFFLSLSTKPLKIRFSIIPALVAGVPSPFLSTSTPFSKAPFPAISIDFKSVSLDDAVAEVIIKIVSNTKFASMMQEKINMKVDTSEIEKEIDNYQKELRKSHSTKFKLIEEIDNLDADDKHYKRRKQDLDDRLYRMYDKIEDLESLLIDAKAKKQTIEAEKLTGDNIYKILIYFDKLYKVMNDVERRQLITALISEIQIYEEKQPNGQWLKSITFKLPIIDEDLNIGLDNNEQVEVITLLSKLDSKRHISV